jgi:hypothetical protein
MLAGAEKALQNGEEEMTAIEALLTGLVDYAGLFPPASLDMPFAVRNYAEYRSGNHAWMLGRFIVPVQRLTEFTKAFNEACCDEQGTPWLLSVLSSGDINEDKRLLENFGEGAAFIQALEVKAGTAAQLEQLSSAAPQEVAVYAEIAPEQCQQMIPVLLRCNARAKIRTGGTTADAFPGTEQIAHFLVSCAKAKVPFKATAGLHHPLRSIQKLTCGPESGTARMHGFINVFVAATVAYYGATESDVLRVLQEQDASAFQWSRHALSWREQKFSAEQIREVRENFAIGFGSCSFTEPVNDLLALGWL